jgi:hypothetical protein
MTSRAQSQATLYDKPHIVTRYKYFSRLVLRIFSREKRLKIGGTRTVPGALETAALAYTA